MNQLFPVFLKLENLSTLLVGAGNVGLEKLHALLSNSPNAKVTVVAPMVREEIFELSKVHPFVTIETRGFEMYDLDNKDLVVLATDQPTLHISIKQETQKRHILTNVADTPDLCDFYLGSIVQKGDLKIAISTNGKSPTIAKRIKEWLSDVIPDDIQDLLGHLQAVRATLKGDFQAKIKVLNELTASMVEK
jgi:precorrin-2 dehydrogenase / sirohydrochlorin ferrochelatase